MIVNSSDFQNNVGKYLDLASGQDIVITRNGAPVARLVGAEKTISFLSDKLVGILPQDIDLGKEKTERLARK